MLRFMFFPSLLVGSQHVTGDLLRRLLARNPPPSPFLIPPLPICPLPQAFLQSLAIGKQAFCLL